MIGFSKAQKPGLDKRSRGQVKRAPQLLVCPTVNFSFAQGLGRDLDHIRREMHSEWWIDELKCLTIHRPETCAQRLMATNNLVNALLKRCDIKRSLNS